jgi:HSP20 family protein
MEVPNMLYRNNRRRIRTPRRLNRRNWPEYNRGADFWLGGTRGPIRRDYPFVNAWKNDEEDLILSAELPGYDPENIDISITGDRLTLKATQMIEEQPKEPVNLQYHRRERFEGNVARTITLPFEVDVEAVEATYQNGILTLELPRLPEEKPRKIAVSIS